VDLPAPRLGVRHGTGACMTVPGRERPCYTATVRPVRCTGGIRMSRPDAVPPADAVRPPTQSRRRRSPKDHKAMRPAPSAASCSRLGFEDAGYRHERLLIRERLTQAGTPWSATPSSRDEPTQVTAVIRKGCDDPAVELHPHRRHRRHVARTPPSRRSRPCSTSAHGSASSPDLSYQEVGAGSDALGARRRRRRGRALFSLPG